MNRMNSSTKVKRAMKALQIIGLNAPERHNVVVPGTETTIESSYRLLREAIAKSGRVSLYLGLNVCPYICRWCRYNNKTGNPSRIKEMISRDVKLLTGEINLVISTLRTNSDVSSIYIGGGTPTLAEPEQIRGLLNCLRQHFSFSRDTEVTIETTPDTIGNEKLQQLIDIGVNRFSMGIQWLNDAFLKASNRIHTTQDVQQTLKLFRNFDVRFNVDLIYGFESQQDTDLTDDTKKILEFQPTEFTLYRLEIQKRTDDRPIKIRRMGPEKLYLMQQAGRELLTANGYIEGPSGWFTRQGSKRSQCYEDRWSEQIPLLGFGPEAYSYSVGQQHTNWSYRFWVEKIENGQIAVDPGRIFQYNRAKMDDRRMAFELKSKFSTGVVSEREKFFKSLQDVGLGNLQGSTFSLTAEGIIVVEEIIYFLTH